MFVQGMQGTLNLCCHAALFPLPVEQKPQFTSRTRPGNTSTDLSRGAARSLALPSSFSPTSRPSPSQPLRSKAWRRCRDPPSTAPDRGGAFRLPGPPRAHAHPLCVPGTLRDPFPPHSSVGRATPPSHPVLAEEHRGPSRGAARARDAAVPGCGAALARRGLGGGAERGGVRGG